MPEYRIGQDFTPDNRVFARTTVEPRLPMPVMHAGGIEFGKQVKTRYDPLKAMDAWSRAMSHADKPVAQ